MNCLFWNVRGINAPGRKQNLIDLIAKTRPSIIGLQETKKEAISDFFFEIFSRQ